MTTTYAPTEIEALRHQLAQQQQVAAALPMLEEALAELKAARARIAQLETELAAAKAKAKP